MRQVAVDFRLDAEEAGESDERRHELCVDGFRRAKDGCGVTLRRRRTFPLC